ncbi:hypothetical protein F5B20DRAFT_536073 [Whalleya microplaca]|nr:hypothetical protein F5B20DRAFT_536073 [Whalleya microplaca]
MDNLDTIATVSEFPYPVYLGVWTNWSAGRVVGATLTLTQNNASLLIAFLAFFVTVVSTYLWKIICFVLHATYSSEERRDMLHHQRQALIRNSSGPAASAVKLLWLSWAWRKLTNPWRRLLPLFFGMAVLATLLALASGFSSRIATGNEVLLSGANCGMVVNGGSTDNPELISSYWPYQSNAITAAANYASQCYSNTTTSRALQGCGTFVKPQLSFSINRGAPCPFGDLCKTTNGSSLELDTGYLNSHDDFGINGPEKDRFLYRRVLQCAPLKTEGYKTTYNLTQDRSFSQYYYGSNYRNGNYTYEVSNDEVYERTATHNAGTNGEYSLGSRAAFFINGSLSEESDFEPIPELFKTDGDIWLIYLTSSGVFFLDKTEDPWYQATHAAGAIQYGSSDNPDANMTVYAQDEAGAPLACIKKEQFCQSTTPNDQNCTPLRGEADAYPSDDSGNMAWSMSAPFYSDPYSAIRTLSAQSLVSRSSLHAGLQAALPDNQWEIDVQHWFEIGLASLQKLYLDYAAGPTSSFPEILTRRPATDEEKYLCSNQKVISTAYVSFSLFGLIFLFVGGLVLIIISANIESIALCFQRRFKRDPFSRLEWAVNDTLQLQRLAFEELGVGKWNDCDKDIPFTKDLVQVSALDVSDLKHPKLSRVKAETWASESTCVSTDKYSATKSPGSGGLTDSSRWESDTDTEGARPEAAGNPDAPRAIGGTYGHLSEDQAVRNAGTERYSRSSVDEYRVDVSRKSRNSGGLEEIPTRRSTDSVSRPSSWQEYFNRRSFRG